MRRSERIAAMTKMLTDRPNEVVSLTEFVEFFKVAKSTVSEDVAIIRAVLARIDNGRIETVTGASGGVRYVPLVSPEMIKQTAWDVCRALSDPKRVLPGNFLYTADVVSDPSLMARIGEIFATRFRESNPTVVATVETRGIPIALMTARAFNIPLAIVRRSSRLTDGTVVTMNYISGSAKRIQTMSLSRRALSEGDRVLVVDDFMKAGGTAKGVIELASEFNAVVVGIAVLIKTAEPVDKVVKDDVSLVVLDGVDDETKKVEIRPSEWVLTVS